MGWDKAFTTVDYTFTFERSLYFSPEKALYLSTWYQNHDGTLLDGMGFDEPDGF